jgi:hypothetical protein
MDKIASVNFSSFVTDSFNQKLARECIGVSNQVLDYIHVLIFDAFPLIAEDAMKWERLEGLREPLSFTYGLVKERSSRSSSNPIFR